MNHKTDEQKFAELLSRYLSNSASEEEKRYVLAWIESLNEDERTELSHQEQSAIKKRIWDGLSEKTSVAPKPERKTRTLITWRAWPVAASVLFILGFSLYYSSNEDPLIQFSKNNTTEESIWTEIRNPSGNPKQIDLDDGSRIILQPSGTLSYMSFRNAKERSVRLQGEASFDVAHDATKPFVVYSEEIVTRVLGTRFTIKAPGNGKDISVLVKSGRVAVSGRVANAKDQELILTPNQEAVYNPGKKIFLKSIIEKNTLPEVSKLVFDEESVGEILRLFEKVYEIDIEFDDTVLDNCIVTTAFAEEGLYERLTILTRIIGASYSEVDGKIVVTSSGCN